MEDALIGQGKNFAQEFGNSIWGQTRVFIKESNINNDEKEITLEKLWQILAQNDSQNSKHLYDGEDPNE
jgi:hypothetical protein